MVGTEVLRRLKVMLPETRVIMMSAFASIDLAVEAMKLGASDFVRKPMTPDTLRNAVAAALAKMFEPDEAKHEDDVVDEQSRQVTLNGFTILRGADMIGLKVGAPNERSFMVRAPDGHEQEMVVEIAGSAISTAEKVAADLPLAKSFWTEQAERFLSDFLWNDGHVPARLTLKEVERGSLQHAARKEVSK